jgi:glycosyltransferase involved in cell wall biosynthesis
MGADETRVDDSELPGCDTEAEAPRDAEAPSREQQSFSLNKVVIYVPAYNAAATLPRVLDRIPPEVREKVHEILVVDNHSEDNTYLVAAGYRAENNVFNLEVIRNERNEGYGGSQKIAYQRALKQGLGGVAMLHGDAQYAPELLERLLDPVLRGEADMVFGSRMAGDPRAGGMPLIRYLGNRFLTTVQNFVLGTKISEFHSGYRVYSVDALRRVPFKRCASDYHFDTETLILFVHHGLRIKELPIPTHYGSEKNYVNIWRYGLQVLVTTVTYSLHRRGLRRSRNWSRILGG